MNQKSMLKMTGAGRAARVFGLLLLALLLLAAGRAGAEEKLKVSLPETVKGYTPCKITIQSPADGEAVLRLVDAKKNCWLIRRENVTAGENKLDWDGLGANGERMLAGPFRFEVTVTTVEGQEYTATAKFNINATTPSVVYALPSSDTLYLDHGERWFVEVYTTVADCLVAMEVRDEAGKTVYTREETVDNEDGISIRWAGSLNNSKKIKPGNYTVSVWSKLNKTYTVTFPLNVEEKTPAAPAAGPTGPIIPERGMSDEEIWEIMMKPSFVIDGNGSFLTFDLYSLPSSDSRPVGTLRCALQGLEILNTVGDWAHVRAWSHEGGYELIGYIQLRKLVVYSPQKQYGILVDKRDQTLTLFEYGKRIATVPVSTGLKTPGNSYRETPPGAFLTDVHFGSSFAQDGYRYEYPLRYDAGNIIHGVGFVREGRVKDYSDNLPLLGQKASHGCVRVSSFLEEGEFLNIFWLWTHLPYHTRVIILDD